MNQWIRHFVIKSLHLGYVQLIPTPFVLKIPQGDSEWKFSQRGWNLALRFLESSRCTFGNEIWLFGFYEILRLYAVAPASMRSFLNIWKKLSFIFGSSVYNFNCCTIGSDIFCFVRFTSHFKKMQVSSRSVWIEMFDWNYYHVRFRNLYKFILIPNWRFKIKSLSIRFGVWDFSFIQVGVWQEC